MICHVRWSYNLSPINHVPWKVRQVETTKESFGKSNSFPCCFDKYKKKTIPGQGNYCTPFNPWNFDIRKEYGKYEGFFLEFWFEDKMDKFWRKNQNKTKQHKQYNNEMSSLNRNRTMDCKPCVLPIELSSSVHNLISIDQFQQFHVFFSRGASQKVIVPGNIMGQRTSIMPVFFFILVSFFFPSKGSIMMIDYFEIWTLTLYSSCPRSPITLKWFKL